MGRLKALRSTVAPLAPRVGFMSGDEKAQDRSRNMMAPWRTWYHTARWQRLRRECFARDHYTCQRTGIILGGKYPADDSPVANHKTPHKGDPALFWDIDNIETVSKAVHDKIVQAEERKQERAR